MNWPLPTMRACLLALTLQAACAHAAPPPLDAPRRAQVVDALATQLATHYVDADLAARMGAAVRTRQQHGDYDAIVDLQLFARTLTADLTAIAHDKHLRVISGPTPLPPGTPPETPDPALEAASMQRMEASNFGIATVEVLEGNIGYLDVRGFERVRYVAPAITAAMTKLAGTAGLIIDMRANRGGDPAAVAFLCSYLFDARTHLNDMAWREGDRKQAFWTDPAVPGNRYGQAKPIWVLVGPRTFSSGEELSYDLQQLKRATLVGETTGGGANPGRLRPLVPYFAAFIPGGRAINPVSHTSWEGVGVIPDIAVPAEDALSTALALARRR